MSFSTSSTIVQLIARELLDSRGQPALEAEIHLSCGAKGRALVPSGASTGAHEAVELRDADPSRFFGKGLLKACSAVNVDFQKALQGHPADLAAVDELLINLDGTENKSRFGANAILGVSLALTHAICHSENKQLFELFNPSEVLLPTPLVNVINGGAHASNNVDVQEFMIVPLKAESFAEAIRKVSETFMALKKNLSSKKKSTAVGDEGGFAPDLSSNKEALDLLCQSIEQAGYKVGEDIGLALDVAATEFYDSGKYKWEGNFISAEELLNVYKGWVDSYPIKSIEDPFAEDDWSAWSSCMEQLGSKTQIVGDDLFVTNLKRLNKGIELKSANSILVKVNQIGTLTETMQAVQKAYSENMTAILSHRSGDTEDVTIAHLSVGLQAGQIKTGSVCRSERVAKYNELMRIEEEFKARSIYKGGDVFKF